jgi:hypothetical protein
MCQGCGTPSALAFCRGCVPPTFDDRLSRVIGQGVYDAVLGAEFDFYTRPLPNLAGSVVAALRVIGVEA